MKRGRARKIIVCKKSLAAELLSQQGIRSDRSAHAVDINTIIRSVEKTGRLVLVDQATRHASASAIIAAEIAEHASKALNARIKFVTALDTSIPFSEPLENVVLPNENCVRGESRPHSASRHSLGGDTRSPGDAGEFTWCFPCGNDYRAMAIIRRSGFRPIFARLLD